MSGKMNGRVPGEGTPAYLGMNRRCPIRNGTVPSRLE
jgi:hypothetical protein